MTSVLACLGPCPTYKEFVKRIDDECAIETRAIVDLNAIPIEFDWIVCYGYRHRIPYQLIEEMPGRIINLHISLLPWGRGADPVFWASVYRQPYGVSIHQITHAIDTGPLLAQKSLGYINYLKPMLVGAYWAHRHEVELLFDEYWPRIKAGAPAYPQPGGGTFHRVHDKNEIWSKLREGHYTPVSRLGEIGDEIRQAAGFFERGGI